MPLRCLIHFVHLRALKLSASHRKLLEAQYQTASYFLYLFDKKSSEDVRQEEERSLLIKSWTDLRLFTHIARANVGKVTQLVGLLPTHLPLLHLHDERTK